MSFDFSDRVVLVTGSSRGLGKHLAIGFARAGAAIVLAARDERSLAAVAAAIAAENRDVLVVPTDVSDPSSVDALAKRIDARFGRTDVLVNNAGISMARPIFATTPEEWDRIFAVNVRGTFLVTKAISAGMIAKRRGRIVNVASIVGRVAMPLVSAYSASKFAVIGFTQAAAKELAAYDIAVNAVCPGIIDTDLARTTFSEMSDFTAIAPDEMLSSFLSTVPAGRAATMDEVTRAVMFLASEATGYITGQALNVCGGLLAP